jgi:hypothetical protein
VRAKKIAHAQERTQVRDCLWYRDLQYCLDLRRHRPHSLPTDHEDQELSLPVHELAFGTLGKQLMLSQGSQYCFKVLQVDEHILTLGKNGDVVTIHHTVSSSNMLS